jgi:hypothetical protein
MIKPTKAMIAGAAVAGLLTGSFAVRAYAASTSGHAGVAIQTMADAEKGKHACKGQNECKGQGGCKTSDAGCKGKNSCKPARARMIAQPTEPSYLNFSNQAIAARLSEQLGPLCGVGVSTLRAHPKAEVTRSSY